MAIGKNYKFSDFVMVNPLVRLKSSQAYSFIEMKDLSDGQKFAYPSIQRKLTGGARFEEGDTLFARITPCLENGKICQAKNLLDGKGFGSTEFLVFRGKEGISNNDFVFYLSRWDKVRRYAEANLVGTSGRQRVSKDVFKKLELELPDLPTQSRIASILSSLDDKIELNRRMNQTLEQMAQALFNHYFVDNIDPDNLPERWRNSVLKEFGNIVCGKTPSKAVDENFNGKVPFIKIPDMHGLPFILKTQDTLTELGANSQKNKFIPEGSLCVSCIATVGLVSITTSCSQTNQQINSLIPCKTFYKYFLYFSLKGLREHLKILGGGGTMTLNVNTTLFSNIELLKPADEKILQYDKIVTPIMELVLNNLIENNKLAIVRDTLLPKLMSGEIDVDAFKKEGTLLQEEAIENFKTA